MRVTEGPADARQFLLGVVLTPPKAAAEVAKITTAWRCHDVTMKVM